MLKTQKFIEQWSEDALGTKSIFLALYQEMLRYDKIRFEFNERPGVSYSLRGIHLNQKNRPLFVMIDVIDDDPKSVLNLLSESFQFNVPSCLIE